MIARLLDRLFKRKPVESVTPAPSELALPKYVMQAPPPDWKERDKRLKEFMERTSKK